MTLPHLRAGKRTARGVALQVLLECRQHRAFAQELLDKHLQRSSLSPADRRLATQLACGVLRRRATLDAILRDCVSRPRDRVEDWLWEALRLGAYQLVLLESIPAHAAIYETVELATAVGKPRGKKFINAVLRKVTSLRSDETRREPAIDAVPLEHGTYRRLGKSIFADPASHPAEYLSSAFSLPRWLVQRWLQRWGWEECVRLGFWFITPPTLWLRCNLLQTERDTFLAALAEAGLFAKAGEHPQSVRLLDHVPIHTIPGYSRGWFTVQDHSAMRVASALSPSKGQRVLDLCAGPGGKTTHLAELMNNEGEIVACDVDQKRLRTVNELCDRLGITIVQACLLEPNRLPRRKGKSDNKAHEHQAEPAAKEPPRGPFDAILVDVPCSNTGVLGRRPEARSRLKPNDLQQLVVLQTKLLLQAAERIKPGGVIVYSTCSIELEENQNVVQVVLNAMPDMELIEENSQIPGQPADGGYWAKLRRKRL